MFFVMLSAAKTSEFAKTLAITQQNTEGVSDSDVFAALNMTKI
jgi:hypothetical protein